MNPLEETLRDEIRRDGPMRFDRFMDAALYRPALGYYMCHRDPFGVDGDFFTASQLQPVFGQLIAVRIRRIWMECGRPENFSVVELGPGRGEMRQWASPFAYRCVGPEDDLPEEIHGVVFANEFFDALPVRAGAMLHGEPREFFVAAKGDEFIFAPGAPFQHEDAEYVRRYWPALVEGSKFEIGAQALLWIDRISRALRSGRLVAIDYGYSTRESVRFREGTLMTYRRHIASGDVLRDVGQRDITAHVCFTALEDRARLAGMLNVGVESFAATLLAALPLAPETIMDDPRNRQHLKTLLYGMGECFRTLHTCAP